MYRPWINCKKTLTCHLTFAMKSALWLHGCNLLSLFYRPLSGSKHCKPLMIQVVPFSALKLHLMMSQGLLSDLQRIRESWDLILQESKLVAASLGLQQEFRLKRRRRTKTFYGENRSTVYEQLVQLHENEEAGFKVTVFNVALDTLICQITSRSETTSKVNSMFSFIWNSNTDPNDAKAQELAKHYPRDLVAEQFVEEIRHLSNVRETLFEKVTSLDLLNKIFEKGLQNLFPQTCVALRIFVSIPVSISQGERSFSKLALVKNCLQSTMGQDCLSALAVLSLERDLARELNYGSVINSFASRKISIV